MNRHLKDMCHAEIGLQCSNQYRHHSRLDTELNLKELHDYFQKVCVTMILDSVQ